MGVIPDKMFGLHYLDQPDGRNRAYFFLEIDRGTMPAFRRSLHYKQTSFFVKLLAYYQTWQQDLHTQHYGIKNFRVLTVTNSRDRVENMLSANREATSGRGSPLFLFTDEGTLGLSGNPLELRWQSGRGGESVILLHQAKLASLDFHGRELP